MREFGLIGFPLSHSFSAGYFNEKFVREQIAGCTYTNFPIPDIHSLPELLRLRPQLAGLNVTIPYKQQVIPFLDFQTGLVKETGACNCIRIEKGVKTGHNTDIAGFEHALQPGLKNHHHKALVLGTGGASAAVRFVLGRLGIGYRSVSRRPAAGQLAYHEINEDILAEYRLIINTTPLGTFPRTDECPPLPYEALTPDHYLFDLVYNPAETLFLQKGKAVGATIRNGYAMLVKQAEESWRIWNEGAE